MSRQKQEQKIEREELRDDHRIACALERIATLLETLVGIFTPQKTVAKSATLAFKNSKGETAMNITVHINDVPQIAVFTEFAGPNGTGLVVPPTTIAIA